MEDRTANTSTKDTSLKSVFCDSTVKCDGEGVYNRKYRYVKDDGSRRKMSQKRPSPESTAKQKRHQKVYKKGEIIGRQDVFYKRIYYTRFNVYEDKIDMLINSRMEICTFLKRIGLDTNNFLQDFTQRIDILMKDIKENDYNQEFIIFGKLELFLKHYLKTNVLQDKHKTIEGPKIINKFRSLSSVVTTEAAIVGSGEDIYNMVSKIVVIQGGIVTYSRHCLTICCVTKDGDRNEVHCPSSVTDLTRIGQDTVLATLPFRKMILIINPFSFKIKTLQLGFYLVSYLERSRFIGVEMFCKTIYVIDWDDNTITDQFSAKEVPADIAVGPENNVLISFSNINRVTCYNLDGQQLFEVCTKSLDLPTHITVYQNHFYVLQGHIIYRISVTGGVTKREIGMKCQYISVDAGTIFLVDYFGMPHIIATNKEFWPRMSYSHQLCTPSLEDHINFEECYNITDILPMSTSSILIIYRNKKAILFTDTGEIISQNNLTLLDLPSIVCKLNSNRFLVFYREMERLQYITCPELSKGPLIKVHSDYVKICNIVSNKCLALTTRENKYEVHILLIKEEEVEITQKISLEHDNVTIAATPINFVVIDGKKHKLVFYSTSGEELFEKYLPFYGYPHHIYSDNVYYYVLFKRQSIVVCYDIYGEIKWQWQLPFPVHPHIAVFQGTVYLPDTQLNRVLLYKYQDWSSGCCLHLKNPYIRNLNLRLKEKENDKLLIAKICHLANGQLVVSDINHDCLLYISNGGDIVSRLSLPSTATDICQWDSNQIGVTLPLEKQLRVIGNLSKTVRSVSLSHPYVQVCKLGIGQIACYCDKPSHLDILTIKNYNQAEIIHRIDIPSVVKSLAIEHETLKLLIVTRGKAFHYNTNISGGGHCSNNSSCDGRIRSIKMVPTVLLSRGKPSANLYGGSIDKMFVYLIHNNRMFSLNDHNLEINDLVTNSQLNMCIDFVDVFSRNICVSEMLSSILHLQDLTVSDKARHIHLDDIPLRFGDKQSVEINSLVITGNNLIVGYDKKNKNLIIVTFDGKILDSIKLNVVYRINMCRWQSNTIAITTGDYNNQLLTLKVEFPLSLVIYQTEKEYYRIASFSNNQMLCSGRRDVCSLYVVEIDEIHLTVNEIKQIDIPETLLTRDEYHGRYDDDMLDIAVTTHDMIIVGNERFIIFFNSDGQYLHSVRHYMGYFGDKNKMTIDDSYLYIYGVWDKYRVFIAYNSILCWTEIGEYNKIFLNKRIYKDYVNFPSINCKGPRFVGSNWNKLYIEGLFKLNRERFPISRLRTDIYPVQVKDIDISDKGHTVVCEKVNNGNLKIFDEDGKLLCCRNAGSLVGGVCFTREGNILATFPNRQEIFQLKQQGLEKYKVWQSRVPYGVIWRKVGNIYLCVHINLIDCDSIKIDGEQLEVLKSFALLKLDSDFHFPSISSQMNNEIFSNELINKVKYSGGDERGEKRAKSGEITCKSRLKVRCGNYIAESMSGIDEISVRRLPHRTSIVPLSIPTFDEPVNYDCMDIRDNNSKLIKLDDNVSVLLFRDTVILIRTTTGDILQHKQLPQQPLGICRWTDERFIVVFGKEMMVFNRDLCRLETIETKKYYNTIYKYNDNQLVCGGYYIRDITPHERDKHYGRFFYNNNFHYFCKDPNAYNSYYVDVVDLNDGTCKYEVCHGKTSEYGKLEGDSVVFDVVVTYFGDVVVARREKEEGGQWCDDDHYFVDWYTEQSLVRRIKLQPRYNRSKYNIYRPCLTAVDEYVYIKDAQDNIYQIPGHIESQTFEDSEHLQTKDIEKYLLLREDDNEVFQVLGFDISDNSFMVFGIFPGHQSFAFFHYDK